MAETKQLIFDSHNQPIGYQQGNIVAYYYSDFPETPFSNLYYSPKGFDLFFDDQGNVSAFNTINPKTNQKYKHKVHVNSVEQAFALGKAYIFYKNAQANGDEQAKATNVKLIKDIVGYNNSNTVIFRKFGRQVAGFDPQIWDRFAGSWMEAAMTAKIKADPDVYNTLKKYQDCTFLEAAPKDGKWGGHISVKADDLSQFTGENRQGSLLKGAFRAVEGDHQYAIQQEQADEQRKNEEAEKEAAAQSSDPRQSLGMYSAGGLKAGDDINYLSAEVGNAGFDQPNVQRNANSKPLVKKPYVLALTGGQPFMGADSLENYAGQDGLYKDNSKLYSMNPMKFDADGKFVNDPSSPWLQTELQFEDYLQKQVLKHGTLEIHSGLNPGADMMWALAAAHVKNTVGGDRVHLVIDKPYNGQEQDPAYGPKSDMKRDYSQSWLQLGKENREIYQALLDSADQVNTYGFGKDDKTKQLLTDKSRQAMLRAADEVVNFNSPQAISDELTNEFNHFGNKVTEVDSEKLGFEYHIVDTNNEPSVDSETTVTNREDTSEKSTEPSSQKADNVVEMPLPDKQSNASEQTTKKSEQTEKSVDNDQSVNDQAGLDNQSETEMLHYDPKDIPPTPDAPDESQMPPEEPDEHGDDQQTDNTQPVQESMENQSSSQQNNQPDNSSQSASSAPQQDLKEQFDNLSDDSIYKNKVKPGKIFTISAIGHTPQDMRNALVRSDKQAASDNRQQNWARYLSYSKEYAGQNKNDQFLMAQQLYFEKMLSDQLAKHGKIQINCSFGAGTETAFTRAAIALKHKKGNYDKVILAGSFAGLEELASRGAGAGYIAGKDKGPDPYDTAVEETKLMLNEMDKLTVYRWDGQENGKIAKLGNKPLIYRQTYGKKEIRQYLHGNPSIYDKLAADVKPLADSLHPDYALPKQVYYQLEHDKIDTSHSLIACFDGNSEKHTVNNEVVIGRNNRPVNSVTSQLLAYAQKKPADYNFADKPSFDQENVKYQSDRNVSYQDEGSEAHTERLDINWMNPEDIGSFLDIANDQKHRPDLKPGKRPNIWNVKSVPIGAVEGGTPVTANIDIDRPNYRKRVLNSFKQRYSETAGNYQTNSVKLPTSKGGFQASNYGGDHQTETDINQAVDNQPTQISDEKRRQIKTQADKNTINRQNRRNKEKAADESAAPNQSTAPANPFEQFFGKDDGAER